MLVQARAAVEELCAELTSAREIEWTALKRAATPRLITAGEPTEFNREGVTVWRESQEPWRPVRRLIVLGFAQGQYPEALGRNAVFSAEDLAAIVRCTGLPVRDAGGGTCANGASGCGGSWVRSRRR